MSGHFSSVSEIFQKKPAVKAPSYPWQDLALRVIKELSVPNFKRSAVFKVCKEKPAGRVELALNDTKELCRDGARWKYFFKIIDQY
ncbi:MAG: hypothetical protein WC453_03625 [Patescibacteria group bacterium]